MSRSADTFIWVGTNSGAYNNGANWINSTGSAWASNQYPGYDGATTSNINGDQIYYSTTCAHAPSGYNANSLGVLGGVTVTNQYSVSSGSTDLFSATTPLTINTGSTANVIIDGSSAGNIYLSGGSTGISQLFAQSTGTGKLLSVSGLVPQATLYKGTILLSSTTTSLNVLYKTIQASDVNLSITSGAVITTAQCIGGVVSSSAAIPTLVMSPGAGVWTQYGNITTLKSYGGMLLMMSGNISNGEIHGPGILDGSKSNNAMSWGSVSAITIYPGGSVNANNGLQNIAFPNSIVDFGGSVQLTPGTILGVSYA